jgi:hypothetical protein
LYDGIDIDVTGVDAVRFELLKMGTHVPQLAF